MSETGPETPRFRGDGTWALKPHAGRRLWIAALLLGCAGAILWPAQWVFRPSSPVIDNRAPPSSPAPFAPNAILIDQTRLAWRDLEAILEPCDRAVGKVNSTPSSSAEGAAAARAMAARDACRRAGLSLLAMRPPQAVTGPERAAFNDALERCQYVYLVEGNSHGRLAEALGTGAADATKFEAWADVHEANINALSCRIGFIVAARKAGMPSSLFEATAPSKPAPATRPTRRPDA